MPGFPSPVKGYRSQVVGYAIAMIELAADGKKGLSWGFAGNCSSTHKAMGNSIAFFIRTGWFGFLSMRGFSGQSLHDRRK
jgi:hypothetical protein